MIEIEGYEQAVTEERRDRAIAFLGQPENILGVPIVPMTPVTWEWFRATGNPYVCGGKIRPMESIHALWLISAAFTAKAEDYAAFKSSHLILHAMKLQDALFEYFDRMFLDSPDGREGVPYYAAAASLIYAMAEKPFGWDMERTMKTPLPILFQLIKARDKASGEPVCNRKSDKVKGDWLRDKNAALAKQRLKEERRAKRQRAKQPPVTDNGS